MSGDLDFLYPELTANFVLVNGQGRAYAGLTTPNSSSVAPRPRWIETFRWNGAGYEPAQADVLRMPLAEARERAKRFPGSFVVECPVGHAVPEDFVTAARALAHRYPVAPPRPPPAPAPARRGATTPTIRAFGARWAVLDDSTHRYLGAGTTWVSYAGNARQFGTREEAQAEIRRLGKAKARVVDLALSSAFAEPGDLA